MTSIIVGSRLHFGLMDVRPPFGGIGVMIDHPALTITGGPDVGHSAAGTTGELATRTLASICDRLDETSQRRLRSEAFGVSIDGPLHRHVGLGSGTQVAMAVAELVVRHLRGQTDRGRVKSLSGRGKRSLIGQIGYTRGGCIFENGAEYQRLAVAPQWRIVVAIPKSPPPTVSGQTEKNLFSQLPPPTDNQRSKLRAARDEIKTALSANDFDRFATSLTLFNRLSGGLFESVQDGIYRSPQVQSLVDRLLDFGVRGVGQSSWGPGVMAWCPNATSAETLLNQIREDIDWGFIATVDDHGRKVH